MARWRSTSVVIALTLLLALFYSRQTSPRVTTGTVVEFASGQSISIASDQTGPSGMQFSLRETTSYSGVQGTIAIGSRVVVSYRGIGERRPVAAEVRLLGSPNVR
jgi:hypothetical protein